MRVGAAALAVVVALWGAGCDREKPSTPNAGARGGGVAPVAVQASPVERGSLQVTSEYNGELFAEAVDVAPRFSGTLVEVAVKLGEKVEKGQLLARLDDAELVHQHEEAKAALLGAQASARSAEATLRLARTELARKAPLAADQLISAQEMSELEARIAALEGEVASAKAQAAQAEARVGVLASQRRDARLVAPFDGRVAERRLDPGATVGPTTPVIRIVKAGPPQIRFRVPERALGTLREGMPLQVRTAATGKQSFAGKVMRIGSEVSRTDRAVQVEGVTHEESPLLRPGMYATVELAEQTLKNVWVVPAIAVLERLAGNDSRQGVFVAVEGRAEWRPVEVLGRAGARTAVEGAINAGEQVLTLGHEDLTPGSPVRVVPRTPDEAPPAVDAGSRG